MDATITPRPHQVRTLEAVRDSVRRGNKRIVVASPTGSGKMLCAAMLMESASEKSNPAIFLADTRELIHQHERELLRLGVNFGTLMAGVEAKSTAAMVQVIGKDTLLSRAFRRGRITPPTASVIAVDEAHKSTASGWKTVLEYYPEAFIVGFTATPCKAGMGDFYQDLIVGATYKELQAAGYLVPCRVYAPSKPDLSGLKISKGDFAEEPLSQRMNTSSLVGNVIRDWKKYAEGRITICYAVKIEHSIHLRNEFRRAGINAEHIDGSMQPSQRDDLIGALGEGKIQVLTNCGVMCVGVDVPIVKCVVLVRPTKSLILYRQICGRPMRPYPGYSDCILIDHAAAVDIHECFPDDDMDWSLTTAEKNVKPTDDPDGNPKGRPWTCKHCKSVSRGKWCQTCGKQKETDPYVCKKCGHQYLGPQCPKCGYRPEAGAKPVKMGRGELEERQRKERREHGVDDKQKTWNECVGVAIGQKMKIGTAAHLYKQRYGVFPANSLRGVPRGASQWNLPAREFYEQFIAPTKTTPVEVGA